MPAGLKCSITLCLMKDPVQLSGDGKLYERAAIEAWLKSRHTSPLTNIVLTTEDQRQLVPQPEMRARCQQLRAATRCQAHTKYQLLFQMPYRHTGGAEISAALLEPHSDLRILIDEVRLATMKEIRVPRGKWARDPLAQLPYLNPDWALAGNAPALQGHVVVPTRRESWGLVERAFVLFVGDMTARSGRRVRAFIPVFAYIDLSTVTYKAFDDIAVWSPSGEALIERLTAIAVTTMSRSRRTSRAPKHLESSTASSGAGHVFATFAPDTAKRASKNTECAPCLPSMVGHLSAEHRMKANGVVAVACG